MKKAINIFKQHTSGNLCRGGCQNLGQDVLKGNQHQGSRLSDRATELKTSGLGGIATFFARRCGGAFVLAVLSVMAVSCNIKEDLRGCPVQGTMDVTYNWVNLPAGVDAPQAMRLMLYHDSGAQLPYNTDNKGDKFDLDRGFYTLLAYNTDEPAIKIHGLENGPDNGHIEVLELESAPDIPNHPASAQGREGQEPFIMQPQKVYCLAETESDLFIEIGYAVPKEVILQNHLRQVLVIAKIQGDFQEVTDCYFEITGIVKSIRMHDRAFVGDPAMIFGKAVRTDDGYSNLFTVLGKHESVPSNIKVHIDCSSDTHYDFDIDISQALQKINVEGTISSTITITFEVADKHELGYDLELIGWDSQDGGNLDIDFKE